MDKDQKNEDQISMYAGHEADKYKTNRDSITEATDMKNWAKLKQRLLQKTWDELVQDNTPYGVNKE